MKVYREQKPWGHELIIACTEKYAAKILCIRAGHRLSLQHHVTKDETLFLLEGETELELQVDTCTRLHERMALDQSYRVRPGQRHRLTALTAASVLEISTPELDDVVRWEDDYGRVAFVWSGAGAVSITVDTDPDTTLAVPNLCP